MTYSLKKEILNALGLLNGPLTTVVSTQLSIISFYIVLEIMSETGSS